MEYQKSSGVQGGWVKASEVASGTKAKLLTECVPSESVWEGKTIKNNVAKVRFSGETGDPKNVNINKPSINALIDAFGTDSKNWIGHVLTAHTEKMLVGGKRVTALYFIPEGYEIKEDEGGYLVIVKVGKPVDTRSPEAIAEDINPDDIPF